MKTLMLGAAALMGMGLIASPGVAANFGSVTLKAGETQIVDISTSARTMRVCNDAFSSGSVVALIGGAGPHDLLPGVCAEEIGDRMTLENHAGGLATVVFRSLSDAPGSRFLDD